MTNKLSKSAQILIAMCLGLTIGYWLDSAHSSINIISNAFVMLLQMTALPYIILSIIIGFARIDINLLKASIKHCLIALFALMSLVIVVIFIAPLSFPDWQNADFYSAHQNQVSGSVDFLSLFIPTNPFSALSDGIIPAIVMFCLLLGLGISSAPKKRYAITVLTIFRDAVANINSLIMQFAPLAICCIAIKAMVQINTEQLDGLTVYLATSVFIVITLSLVILPAVISVLTPFSYRQIIKATREPMLTAFATGSFFAVLPLIIEKINTLQSQHLTSTQEKFSELPNILVPITFSLPVGGKLLALLFPLFAAWFSGAYIGASEYSSLLAYGIPQLFGSTIAAMPKLLEHFNVPSSMFDLYLIADNLIVARTAAVLSVSFATALPLFIIASLNKQVKVNIKRFHHFFIYVPPLFLALLFSLRFGFEHISHQYQGYNKFIERDFLLQQPHTKYLNEPDSILASKGEQDALTRIQQRGFLRVGYFRDDLPYSFHNHEGKLVGFDIEIFNQLAIDLNVDIEFVKIYRKQAAPLLASGYLDITSGVPLIPDNMSEFSLSSPYSDQSIALVVKDKRYAEFTTWKNIINKKDLIIGIPETFFYTKAINRTFIHGKAWEISTPRLFFKEEYQHIDAMLFGGAAASAWTLLNPDYSVVTPKPIQPPLPMAFPISKDDRNFELFMRNWIVMKSQNNTIKRLFSYWIEGKHEH